MVRAGSAQGRVEPAPVGLDAAFRACPDRQWGQLSSPGLSGTGQPVLGGETRAAGNLAQGRSLAVRSIISAELDQPSNAAESVQ